MEQIGRYRIVSELGRGAMGVVYKAQDPTIGRMVAIKTIRLGELAHPQERQQLRDRLFREAQSAGILSHPGIVTIYDISEEGNLAYITMEFVEGQALEKILDAGAVSDAKYLVSLATQTAVALDYAHTKGIIHRDIKPGNIMVTPEGQVKITDFGIARIASSKFTNTGTVMGTPSYMSPEQVRGAQVDGRSDMFSLGVVIYEMLTGQKPFYGESITTIIFKIVSEMPVSPKELNNSVGVKLDAVVMRALSKDPAERYVNCRAFAEALEAAAAQSVHLTPTMRKIRSLFLSTESSDPALVTQEAQKTPAPPPGVFDPPAPAVVAREEIRPEPPPAAAPPADQVAAAARATLPPLRDSGPAATALSPAASGRVLPPLEAKAAEKKAERKPEKKKPVEMPAPPAPPVAVLTEAAAPPRRWLPLTVLGILAIASAVLFLWRHKFAGPVAPAAPPKAVETAAKSPAPSPAPKPPAAATPVTPTPAVKPPEETPAPSRGTQPINIATEERGAKAIVDGNEETACTTPCTITVPQGSRTLVLTQAGFHPERRILTVTGEPVNIRIPMRPILGTVMLSTTPAGATVTVDGKPRFGQTPMTLNLPLGKHVIVVTKEGVGSAEQTIDVTDDAILHVSMSLIQR